jgi:hypothetical protein
MLQVKPCKVSPLWYLSVTRGYAHGIEEENVSVIASKKAKSLEVQEEKFMTIRVGEIVRKYSPLRVTIYVGKLKGDVG